MKLEAIVIAAAMLLTSVAWADAPTTTAVVAPAAAEPTPLQLIDSNLSKMHDVIGRAQQTQDAAQRRAVLMEYMQLQHDNMQSMRAALGDAGPGMSMMMQRPDADGLVNLMGERCQHEGNMQHEACHHGEDMHMGEACKHGGMNAGCHHGDGWKPCGMESQEGRLHDIEQRLDALQDMIRTMMRNQD